MNIAKIAHFLPDPFIVELWQDCCLFHSSCDVTAQSPKTEILDFQKRGILTETDYLRDEGSDSWVHYQEWLTVVPMPEPKLVKKPVEKVKAPAAKAPAAKKSKKAA